MNIAILLFAQIGCVESYRSSPAEQISQGKVDPVIQNVMLDRARHIDLYRENNSQWKLDGSLPKFSRKLQPLIREYTREIKSFEANYSGVKQSIPSASSYLALSKFDPVTACERNPINAHSNRSSHGKDLYEISYTVEGNQGHYIVKLKVQTVFEDNKWVIQEIYYPKNYFPELTSDQSLTNFLKHQIYRARESGMWAKTHQKDLRTQAELLQSLRKNPQKSIFDLQDDKRNGL
jgi:hypothetical protein